MHSRQEGFTLIEILVVVAILGVLMGLVTILVQQSGRKKDDFITKQDMIQLGQAIERYKQELGQYPPMDVGRLVKSSPRFAGLAISGGDDANMACECLAVALRHPDLTAPLTDGILQATPPYGNTDDDDWNQTPEGSDTHKAREIVDAWGTPWVYIEKNRYKEGPVRIRLPTGEDVEVYAARKPNGDFYNPATYQLISLGRDAQQDAENGNYLQSNHKDDIFNFELTEDE